MSAKWSDLNITTPATTTTTTPTTTTMLTNTTTPTTTTTTSTNRTTPNATTTPTTTATPYTWKGREKEEPLHGRGKGGKSNSRRCCLCCCVGAMTSLLFWVIMYTHTGQKDRMTNPIISSNVHYVHLGRDNYRNYFRHLNNCLLVV